MGHVDPDSGSIFAKIDRFHWNFVFFNEKNINDNKYPVVLTEPITTGEKISEKFLASDEVSKPHLENFDIILSKERNEPNISQFIDDFENIINENLTKQQIVDLTLKYLPTM